MEDRKLLIRKKAALLKVKRELEQFKSLEIIEILEFDTEEITKYRQQIEEMNKYSYPRLAVRKIEKDSTTMIDWFFQQISILKDDTVWIIPFDETGIWWIKVLVNDCREAMVQLWKKGEVCIIEQKTKKCYYIQHEENNCCILFKQLQ